MRSVTPSGACPASPAYSTGVHDPTVSSARGAVIICRGVAFDRIVLAVAVVMPFATAMCSGLVVGALFGVVALPVVALGLRNVLRQPPLLRGDERGLWFGRGRIVPWHEVKLVYETSVGVRRMFEGISFEFCRRSTWLRLPFEKQLASLFEYGETAVTTRYVTEGSRTALVAQLEAVRTRVVGTEDGIPVGAAAIPSARLLDR